MTYYLKVGNVPVTCATKELRDNLVGDGYVEISKAEFDRLEDQYYQKLHLKWDIQDRQTELIRGR